MTVSGTTPAQRVVEIEFGTPLGEVLERVGAWTTAGQGVMLGDSFGAWADVHQARDLPLDPDAMRRDGLWFGAGVIAVMPATTCGVVQTAQVMAYMAGESAGQCGPCVFGMRGLADAAGRVATRRPAEADMEHLARWGRQSRGGVPVRCPTARQPSSSAACACLRTSSRSTSAGGARSLVARSPRRPGEAAA